MIFFRKEKEDLTSEEEEEEEAFEALKMQTAFLSEYDSFLEKHLKSINKSNPSREDIILFNYHELERHAQQYLPTLLFYGTDFWKQYWYPAVAPSEQEKELQRLWESNLATFHKQSLFYMEQMYSDYEPDVHLWNCENLFQQFGMFDLILNPNGLRAQRMNLIQEFSDTDDKELQAKFAEIGEYERSVGFIVYFLLRHPNPPAPFMDSGDFLVKKISKRYISTTTSDSLAKSLSDLENVKVSFTAMYELFSLSFNYAIFKKYVILFLNRHENIKEIVDDQDAWTPGFFKNFKMFKKPIFQSLFQSIGSTQPIEYQPPPFESKHNSFLIDYQKLCELAGLEFKIPPRILNFFLVFEYNLIKSKQNKAKIKKMTSTSKNKTDCIQQFLDEYPTNWENETSTLERIFQKKSIEFTDVVDDIHQFLKTANLKAFKDSLSSHIPIYTLDVLDLLSGTQFEGFLAKLFTKMGHTAEVTKTSGDQGGDLIISKGNKKTVVQAKRYSDKVGNSAIQEAVTAIRYYDCNNAMVVTTNYFTKSAIELANSNNVVLTDRDYLEELLEEYPIPISND